MTFILSCAVWGESRVTATRPAAGEPPTPSRRGPYTLIFPKVRGKIRPFSYCSSGMFPHAPVLMVGGGVQAPCSPRPQPLASQDARNRLGQGPSRLQQTTRQPKGVHNVGV